MGRDYYTPEGLASMKRKLAVRAIEFWVWEQAGKGENCGDGTAAVGFEFATDHTASAHSDPSLHPLYHYRYPPVDASNSGSRPVLVRYEEPGAPGELLHDRVEDVWATRYQPWFDAVEEVFQGWDTLPDEAPFWQVADNLEATANPIQIDMDASTPTHVAGNHDLAGEFNELWRAKQPPLYAPPPGTGSGPPVQGPPSQGLAVDVFYDTYAAGLDLVIGQQALLINLLAATVRTEGNLWQKSRTTVMEIGDAAVAAMGPEHLSEADVAAAVNVIGDLMNVGSLLPGTPVAAFTGIVGLFCDGLGLYWDANPPPQPTPVEKTLAGATPTSVIDKIRDALGDLNRQIVDEEIGALQLLNAALDQSYIASTTAGVGVNLPPPQLLSETDPTRAVASVDMDFAELRHAAGAMRRIATRLEVATPHEAQAFGQSATWERTPHIGINGTGPRDAWSAL
ncbi:MAG TPA: hypothetical protein VNP92_03385, partial [Actinophytocola sp.]|nr:hypothetical protein [Actinophytocola sp.]